VTKNPPSGPRPPAQNQDFANLATEDAGVPEIATANPTELRAYIGQMAAELATLARSAKLGTLAYLLEMARDEAKGG
jgi:hypothetical protein